MFRLPAALSKITLNGSFPIRRIHIDGRPRFAKLSVGVVKKVEIAAIDSDFDGRGQASPSYSIWPRPIQ